MPTRLTLSLEGATGRQEAGSRLAKVLVLAVVASLALGVVVAARWVSDQDLLAFGLVGAAVFLPIVSCLRWSRDRGHYSLDPLQPGIIMAGLFYVYIVVPAAWTLFALGYQPNYANTIYPPGPQFLHALAVCLWGIAFFGLGYRSNVGQRPVRRTTPRVAFIEWNTANNLVTVLMLIVGATFQFQQWRAAGIGNPLQQFSPTLRVETASRVSGVVVVLGSLFDWGILLLVLKAITTGRRRSLAVLAVIVGGVFTYLLSGKRSAILPYVVIPVIWFHYLRHRISTRRFLLLAATGLVLAAVGVGIRTFAYPLLRAPETVETLASEYGRNPAAMYLNSPDLSTWDMTVVAVTDRERVVQQVGGPASAFLKYNFEAFAYLVPRALWSDKPVLHELGQTFYQWVLGGDSENTGFTVGLLGTGYLFGQLPGLALTMLLLGAVLRLAYGRLRPTDGRPIDVTLYAVFLLMLFHFIRFGTFGFTFLQFINQDVIGVLAVVFLATSGRAQSPRRVTAAHRQS